MKYVFTDVKVYSGMPRYTEEISDYLVRSVGSEILTVLFPKYLESIEKIIGEIIPRNKVEMSVVKIVDNLDKRIHGHITITKKVKNGVDVVAVLSFVEVNNMWAEYGNELKQFSFIEWDKMKFQREKGGQA